MSDVTDLARRVLEAEPPFDGHERTLAQAVLDKDARIQEIEGGGLYRPVAEMNAHIMKQEARIAELETEVAETEYWRDRYLAERDRLTERIAELEASHAQLFHAYNEVLDLPAIIARYKAALEQIANADHGEARCLVSLNIARTALEER